MVSTPHVHSELFTDPSEIAERTTRLNERLRHERLPLSGGELDHRAVERLTQGELELIAQGLPPGSRWLLMEAPFSGLHDDYNEVADELRARGFAVVVAHPERADFTADTDVVLAHEERGSMLQLNAASVAGHSSQREHDTALLAAARRAGAPEIASDAHGPKRMPALTAALEMLAAGGWNNPSRFADTIPRALLERGLDIWRPARVA